MDTNIKGSFLNTATTRRNFLNQGVQAALTFGLAQTLFAHKLFAEPTSRSFELWLKDLLLAGENLRIGSASTEHWQAQVDQLYGAVSLNDLRAHIDFDKLTENFDFSANGEKFIDIDPLSGKPFPYPIPEQGRVITKLAGVRNGLNVPPHGHENTVSAFLVLHGEFHVRQFDKLQTKQNSLVFKKSLDEIQSPGFWSCTSESARNLHWLTATTSDSFFFSTKINNYIPDARVKGRVNVDLRKPIDHGSGIKEARIISDREAHDIYNQISTIESP